jgi:hypothetical protein
MMLIESCNSHTFHLTGLKLLVPVVQFRSDHQFEVIKPVTQRAFSFQLEPALPRHLFTTAMRKRRIRPLTTLSRVARPPGKARIGYRQKQRK